MLDTIFSALSCPNCYGDFKHNEINKSCGSILCESCCTETPIIRGFPLFTETRLCDSPSTREQLMGWESKLCKPYEEYENFIYKKHRRPLFDSYAAFQPFNESTQSFYPFLDALKQSLNPGDIILDTWCRTAWSGEFLAGYFPEQTILSIWEGNTDLLAYRGFHFWLNADLRSPNLQIIFHHCNHTLPIKNHSISAIHGLESLHRYKQDRFTKECLRIAKKDAPIFFPHVHLTNNEPDPYFDRGEIQLHGKTYHQHFTKRLKDDTRKAFVLSEPQLFKDSKIAPLKDQSETEDYNALIALLPNSWENRNFVYDPVQTELIERSFFILNPLYDVNFLNGTLAISTENLGGTGPRMAMRHPVFHQRMLDSLSYKLSPRELELIFWVKRLYTGKELCEKLCIQIEELESLLKPLLHMQLLTIAPVSSAMARLQNFYSDQIYRLLPFEETCSKLWKEAQRRFSELPLLLSETEDESLSFEECSTLVYSLAIAMRDHGLSKGDRVLLLSSVNEEAFLLFWASMISGLVFVAADPSWGPKRIEEIRSQVKPKLIFVDHEHLNYFSKHDDLVVFDHDEGSSWGTEFSSFIEVDSESFEDVQCDANDLAVILFTSGTTAQAKGVCLSHRSLYRSSFLFSHAYDFNEKDRILALGEFSTMSGLRNSCLLPLHSGCSAIVPSLSTRKSPFAISQCIQEYQCSALSTVPLLIRQFFEQRERMAKNALRSLRFILSTASPLSQQLKEEFEKFFSCPIYDYYGLTETCGFCIGKTPQDRNDHVHSIGHAISCLIQVVDENDSPLESGKVGELRILSERHMLGYLNKVEETQKVLKGSWYYTGDLAKIHEDGSVSLLGRKKEMVKDPQGNCLYPSELESILESHQNISEAVVYFQDKGAGRHETLAFVTNVEEHDPTQLISELKSLVSEHLGPQRVPQHIYLQSSLPRGANGKVQKEHLMKELQA
ncbi:MAG: hypothetical protein CMO81_06205 [Waddliaceae bacterium]|nr:hypothetical protein [Waddliaceae bacterium]